MNSLSYLRILLLIIPIITFSQSIIWEKNFGEILYDQGYSIELTEDNGYIIAGRKGAISESIENTPSLSVDGDFHIIKITEDGNIEWEQSYEDTTSFSYAKCIKKDDINGGYIIGGNCLLKLNEENPPEIEWFNYDINSEDIIITPEGNYISVGGSNINCDNPNNGFQISKIDNEGNLIDIQCFGDFNNGIEKAYSIDNINEDNYLVIGTVNSTNCNLLTPENCGHIPEPSPGSDFGYHGGSDIWVLKIRDNGNFLSQVSLESGNIGKCYGGTGFDQAYDIECVNSEYSIMCGYTESNGNEFYDEIITSSGGGDFWIIKIDNSNGNVLWQKSIGGINKDHSYALDLDPQGNIYITGLSFSNYPGQHNSLFSEQESGDLITFKLDNNGNIIKGPICFGGSSIDVGMDIKFIGNNTCIITGYTDSQVELLPSFIDMKKNGDISSNNGLEDIWVLKIDFNQNFSNINSYNIKKEPIQIINILGKNTSNNKDLLKIYRYEDGTTKKKIHLK